MLKATAAFVLGLACLFVFSLTWGHQVFSGWERKFAPVSRVTKKKPSKRSALLEQEFCRKRARLAVSSFDLANGLTFKEIEDLCHRQDYRLVVFITLLAGFWLALALRLSPKPSL